MVKKTQKITDRKSQYQQKGNSTETNTFDFFKNPIFPFIIVFCLPVLLYLQTLKFGFTDFDDNFLIQNNISFLKDFDNAAQTFITDQFIVKSSSFYRPLGTLSYMLDIKLSGGNDVWMYHLSNILLLGLIACSLFLLLKRFCIPPKLALLSTLIYCVHPLFVSTIAHIPNRAELLLILFALLSFLFFIEFLQKRKLKYWFLHWAAFTIALFCKETAAFLPFLFIIYYFTFTTEKYFEKKYIFLIALYIISGLFWFWLRTIALEGVPNLNDSFGLMPLLSNLRIIPESLAKFFLPSDIAPIPGFSVFKTFAGFVIIFLLGFLLFRDKNVSMGKIIFCFSWFLILMVPSMLYKHPNFDYLDHRFFLPHIGILLLVLYMFSEKWLKKSNIKNSLLIFAIFIVLFSFSFIKSRSYSDPLTFYSTAISQNTNCGLAYNNRGVIYEHQKLYSEAINDYTKAIELKADDYKAFYNRGVLYNLQGLYDKAVSDFTKAIESKPDYAEAYINRGNIYGQKSLFDKALADYTKAINIKPGYALAYNNRGIIYVNQVLYDKAISDFTKAIDLTPNYTEAYHNRGMTYGNKGLYEKAVNDFTKAIDLMPDNAENYNNRGIIYNARGLFDKSCQDFKKAEELGSKEAKDNFTKFCKSHKFIKEK